MRAVEHWRLAAGRGDAEIHGRGDADDGHGAAGLADHQRLSDRVPVGEARGGQRFVDDHGGTGPDFGVRQVAALDDAHTECGEVSGCHRVCQYRPAAGFRAGLAGSGDAFHVRIPDREGHAVGGGGPGDGRGCREPLEQGVQRHSRPRGVHSVVHGIEIRHDRAIGVEARIERGGDEKAADT